MEEMPGPPGDGPDPHGADAGAHAVYLLAGELDFASAPRIFDELDSIACRPGLRRLVVDLSSVGVVDSAGLSVIVQVHNRSLQRGFALSFRRCPRPLLRLLRTTGLDAVLHFER